MPAVLVEHVPWLRLQFAKHWKPSSCATVCDRQSIAVAACFRSAVPEHLPSTVLCALPTVIVSAAETSLIADLAWREPLCGVGTRPDAGVLCIIIASRFLQQAHPAAGRGHALPVLLDRMQRCCLRLGSGEAPDQRTC
jgi:hypothetical protein